MFLWQYVMLLSLIAVQTCSARECDTFTHLRFHHALMGTTLRVRFLLYTTQYPSCGTLVSNNNLTAYPHFNLSRTTTFVIHGYRPTGSPPSWINTISEDLMVKKDMNVVVVDWNHGAANVNYFKAVESTHKAGEKLTSFIKLMQEHGASLSSIHLIGISLGAHISGFAGAQLNGKIGRITALDPAGPQFRDKPPEGRLDPTDAQFVDVLHTDIDALGFRGPLGHIDFYANGGTDQPGCPRTILSGQSYFKCDHQRSVFLFLDSMETNCSITAYPCSSNLLYLDGHCMSCERFGAAGCPVFGYDIIEWKDVLLSLGQTKTFFTTNERSPFCKTNYMVNVVTWNEEIHWGYITITFHGHHGEEAVASINHKAAKFKQYTETTLLARFNKDIPSVEKISLKFTTGNALKPNYKLRILRIRLARLEGSQRALCRYDIVLLQNKQVTFRPIPCEDSNF